MFQSVLLQIKLNEAFNGINFSSAEWEIVATGATVMLVYRYYTSHCTLLIDDTELHRKHTHTGSAHGLTFHVEFLVKEVKVWRPDYGELKLQHTHIHLLTHTAER